MIHRWSNCRLAALTVWIVVEATRAGDGQRQRLAHERFVSHLVDVLTGALTARSST